MSGRETTQHASTLKGRGSDDQHSLDEGVPRRDHDLRCRRGDFGDDDRATKAFEKDGGRALLGTNLLDCHPEPSRTKLRQLLASGEVNAYTIEKGGVRKLIYQAPWHENGEYRGLVEISLVLPNSLPHFVRDG